MSFPHDRPHPLCWLAIALALAAVVGACVVVWRQRRKAKAFPTERQVFHALKRSVDLIRKIVPDIRHRELGNYAAYVYASVIAKHLEARGLKLIEPEPPKRLCEMCGLASDWKASQCENRRCRFKFAPEPLTRNPVIPASVLTPPSPPAPPPKPGHCPPGVPVPRVTKEDAARMNFEPRDNT